MIQRAYKYRIFPNKEQVELFEKHFGSTRFVFNWGLEKKIKAYQKDKKRLTCFDLINELTKLKKEKDFEWLNEVNSQSLQVSLRNLDNAFTNFFRKQNKFPNFKSKKHNKNSFQIPQHLKLSEKLDIPKIKDIKIIQHRKLEGKIKTATISKTTTGKYYISILIEQSKDLPKKDKIKDKTTIGIDLGIKTFATISDGRKIDNPKYLKKSERKLKRQQRWLSRKIKGSKNRNKQRIKVALIHEKINNQRSDFLHKFSYELTHEKQVSSIAIEDLNVKGMVKNHYLARSISDVAWSEFKRQLEYKCDWYGKNLLVIGRFEASSKTCSCGVVNQDLKLSDREWTCKECKTKHDRDILAANNIKKFALIPQGLRKSTPPERMALANS
ncbi:MAG: putative transposase [Patescibacteria group bacterium]|nr:putative transposase [Patescibacteria group bacterium]